MCAISEPLTDAARNRQEYVLIYTTNQANIQRHATQFGRAKTQGGMMSQAGKPWDEMTLEEKFEFIRSEIRKLYNTFNNEDHALSSRIQKLEKQNHDLSEELKKIKNSLKDKNILLG